MLVVAAAGHTLVGLLVRVGLVEGEQVQIPLLRQLLEQQILEVVVEQVRKHHR